MRIRAKRCRYAAEASVPAFGKPARRFAAAMADVQEMLGEHHDAVVSGAWLAKTAQECSSGEAYALGRLAQIEHLAALDARDEFFERVARREPQAPPFVAVSPRTGVVQAAGGVVLGNAPDGAVTVLVVHRPRYDDWSLPKGKLEPGETHEAAAVREVEEETGYRCSLDRELRPLQYVDRNGRDKVVRYWQMSVIETTGWEPNDEVDEVRWIPAGDVADLLTYHDDRHLVAGVLRGNADLDPDGEPR